jgi:pimeloyl-ACP methyl ester carboxylesterase
VNDPFDVNYKVAVAGGELEVARSGPPPDEADAVVLAVHGITASHEAWRAVARELAPRAGLCVLAPDLRGRGRSADLPGPYGLAAHVADLLAVLDDAAVRSAVVAGHSMGGYAAALLAADHPERVAGLVLLDAGPADELPPGVDPHDALAMVLGPAAARLALTFPTTDDYVDMWRVHPAFAHAWNDDVDAYVRYDLEHVPEPARPDAVRSLISTAAVRTDGLELVVDEDTRTAIDRVLAPVWLLRAERGVVDDDQPMIPLDLLDDFAATHPAVQIEAVADVNHYTLLLGLGPGPSRVAAAIESALSRVAAA